MELEGKIWKEGKWWIVEVPCLNVSTQGKTKKNAFLMIKDAIFELIKSYFSELEKNSILLFMIIKRAILG